MVDEAWQRIEIMSNSTFAGTISSGRLDFSDQLNFT